MTIICLCSCSNKVITNFQDNTSLSITTPQISIHTTSITPDSISDTIIESSDITTDIVLDTDVESTSDVPMSVCIPTLDDLIVMFDAIEYSDDELTKYLNDNHFTMNGINTRQQLSYWIERFSMIPIYAFPDTHSIHFFISPEYDTIDVWYDGTESRICIASYYFSSINLDTFKKNINDKLYSDYLIVNSEKNDSYCRYN